MRLQQGRSLWVSIFLIVLLGSVTTPALSKPAWVADIEAWFSDEPSDNEEKDTSAVDEKTEAPELLTVALDDTALQYAGIKTTTLMQSEWRNEIKAQAYVLEITDLVMWSSRLKQLAANVSLAKIDDQAAHEEYLRIKKLAKAAGSVASKNVNYAKATWSSKNAQLVVAQTELDNAKQELSQAWGSVVATWVEASSSELKDLFERDKVMLIVSLPPVTESSTPVTTIYVSLSGSRGTARQAEYASPAYTKSDFVQSETAYFMTDAQHLRPGMRLDAWIQQGKQALSGVMIPEAAIVWYSGQPWAYVQTEPGIFKRRALESGISASKGIFMESGFTEGEVLVTSGAQMLLSEEFRWQINDEDND